MLIYVRRATKNDLDQIMPIIADAKKFLKDAGSPQWQSGYPNIRTIADDIAANVGYVLCVDHQIAGYAAAIAGIEPTYQVIKGEWQNEQDPYTTIHRMALSSHYRGMHLANFFFSNLISLQIAERIHNFRIDTFRKNEVMQHLATSNGFVERGTIEVDDPIDPSRIAFELSI
ncbi:MULTISPECIES: GNAT family N-acetyltransferase [Lactobacillus]|uniref:GNAT family N-acetyltransferase n=1 Tax=Lactobacillus xujianguonis TaxID=2495899 RepID=A0A437SUE1_9LACO|nr:MULTISPECIES: GNAT family N-acetyltransferase [Lactobacillus]RVU70482.1 GNAT family N-acetyltransferase [Lactobacillus xujianguonis]RVU76848.1 GNAT family N-acetyltransferase [Lactobacillus xujianguonis]